MKIQSNSQLGSGVYDPFSNGTSRDQENDAASSTDVQKIQKDIKQLGVKLKAAEKAAGGSPAAQAMATLLSSQIASLESTVTKITNVGAATFSASKAQRVLLQVQTAKTQSQDLSAASPVQVNVDQPASQPQSLKLDLKGTQIDTTA
jgi:hypothetical protein